MEKGILIDPVEKSVKEIEAKDTFSLKEIYKLIDCEIFTCPLVLENGDAFYLDDESLLKAGPYFQWKYKLKDGKYFTFTGKALIIGTNVEGENVSVKSLPGEIFEDIEWLGSVDDVNIEPQIIIF